ncbi:MAG: CDP-diacylglycerol--glycerol-3-phosphate 3-phosphatidyltransferase [Acidobacteria bacterium]|nr:CDP-diacylglycerol--glycerol-3-phosphate 3-phosphatidyltransferase [Acidobacteriota bacterium]
MRQLWTFANQLTLFRLLVIPLVLIAMLYGRHRWALGLFLIAGITDGIDGLVARKLNQRTQLGAYLDPIADKFLLSSSFFILALIGSVPWWVTILVLSRDFLILVTILVVALISGTREFPPSTLGKWNTTIQIATVFAVMLHNAVRTPLTEGLDQTLVWLTAASTVASGVHYAVMISKRFK